MNLKEFLISSVLALTLNSCVSEFDANLPFNETKVFVVNGSIVENSDVIFYLSNSFSLDSVDIPKESLNIEAKLTIIGSNGYQSPSAINMGRGEFRIPIGALDDNVEYGIKIEYGGDIYQSALSKPLTTPEIDSVSFIQPEKNGEIAICISTHDDTKGSKFFLWNYTEDWEMTAHIATTIFLNIPTSWEEAQQNPNAYKVDARAPLYYCWKNNPSKKILMGSTESLNENRIINKELCKWSSENERFSVLYCITVYQRAISKEAHEYYQNIVKFNEEMGGLFTPQPAELKGNITCITNPSKKVMGYVEVVKNTTQKRLFVSREEITRPVKIHYCELISHGDIVPKYAMSRREFYNMGYRPAGGADPKGGPGDPVPLNWAPRSCTECTENRDNGMKGTKNKPDFWPNDHE